MRLANIILDHRPARNVLKHDKRECKVKLQMIRPYILPSGFDEFFERPVELTVRNEVARVRAGAFIPIALHLL